MRKNLEQFCNDDSGAVAVDWVVLSGGVVGLGLATMSVVSGGIEDLSNDIAAALTGMDVGGLYNNAAQAMTTFDFTGGAAAGWAGGQVMDMGGQIGELLVVAANQTASFVVRVPPGATQALMNFDLVAGDSLDGESATISLNGTEIAIATRSWREGPMRFEIPQLDGTTVEAIVTVDSSRIGGAGRWTDSIANVTVAVNQPTDDITFSMHSSADQSVGDEYWGLDNFRSGTTGAPGF